MANPVPLLLGAGVLYYLLNRRGDDGDEYESDGHFRRIACELGYTSGEQRLKLGRDVRKVEAAVKSALGGQFRVYIVGSRRRHTNIGSSDLDLKYEGPRIVTSGDRSKLTAALKREFGGMFSSNVDASSNSNIHIVKGESGSIDVVPCRATYLEADWDHSIPSSGWLHNNWGAQDAARMLKAHFSSAGGIYIGRAVQAEQDSNPEASSLELYNAVGPQFEESSCLIM